MSNCWSISPIATLNSGAPFNITTGTNNNATGYNNDRPNLVPGVNPFLDPHRPRTVSSQAWFNVAAFIPNGPGVAGGIGPGGADGNTPRDYLRAPGYRDIDLGISRDFRFERGIGLQFRADATNAFNIVSLNAPTAALNSSNDGKITAAASPRLIQFGARISFEPVRQPWMGRRLTFFHSQASANLSWSVAIASRESVNHLTILIVAITLLPEHKRFSHVDGTVNR